MEDDPFATARRTRHILSGWILLFVSNFSLSVPLVGPGLAALTLAADAGRAAPTAWALAAAGFKENEEGRMYRQTERGKLYLDVLTDHPPATSGTRDVSDLVTSVCPGIKHARGALRPRLPTGS